MGATDSLKTAIEHEVSLQQQFTTLTKQVAALSVAQPT